MLFISNTKNGRLQSNVQTQLNDYISSLKDARYQIEIKKVKKSRSNNQNRYYWGIIVNEFRSGVAEMWGEYIGSQEAHEYLKLHCNYKELINENSGEIIKLPQTTADRTTIEFEEYLERCRKLIYNYFNRVVALPNESLEIFNEQ